MLIIRISNIQMEWVFYSAGRDFSESPNSGYLLFPSFKYHIVFITQSKSERKVLLWFHFIYNDTSFSFLSFFFVSG